MRVCTQQIKIRLVCAAENDIVSIHCRKNSVFIHRTKKQLQYTLQNKITHLYTAENDSVCIRRRKRQRLYTPQKTIAFAYASEKKLHTYTQNTNIVHVCAAENDSVFIHCRNQYKNRYYGAAAYKDTIVLCSAYSRYLFLQRIHTLSFSEVYRCAVFFCSVYTLSFSEEYTVSIVVCSV